jgi:23S rRNA (adenine2503-C2)-methyltransferase
VGFDTRAWLGGKPLDTGTRNQKTGELPAMAVRNALPGVEL